MTSLVKMANGGFNQVASQMGHHMLVNMLGYLLTRLNMQTRPTYLLPSYNLPINLLTYYLPLLFNTYLLLLIYLPIIFYNYYKNMIFSLVAS